MVPHQVTERLMLFWAALPLLKTHEGGDRKMQKVMTDAFTDEAGGEGTAPSMVEPAG